MSHLKIKHLFILFLFLEIKSNYGMPQGFFSQGLSVPKFVSWNKDRSLTLLPNVKVESPIKSSFINVFGKKNTIDNTDILNKEHQPVSVEKIGQGNGELKASQGFLNSNDDGSGITNHETNFDQSNAHIQELKLPTVLNGEDKSNSKFSAIDENANDNQIGDIEITTETTTETTTDDYETTTFDNEPLNRASPQLVASLLG